MSDTSLETNTLLSILDITRRMAERRAFVPLLNYVIDEILKLVGAERGYVVLLATDGTLDFRVMRDQQGGEVASPADQISTSVLHQVIEHAEPIILRDAASDLESGKTRSIRNLTLRSIMCVPLISYGKVIGAIYIENRSIGGRFKPESLAPLMLFANQAAVAIENASINDSLEALVSDRTRELELTIDDLRSSQAALQERMVELERLQEELRELSIRDSLTGLYNRRYLTEELNRNFAQAKRYDRQMTLAIIDIDNFKAINDTFSHQTGDTVLMAIGRILRAGIRSADVPARFGEEEFVLLFPETGLDEAILCCDRLRVAAEHHPWAQIHADLQVSISIGIANSQSQTDPEQQLRLADSRLHIAKRSGKNQIIAS